MNVHSLQNRSLVSDWSTLNCPWTSLTEWTTNLCRLFGRWMWHWMRCPWLLFQECFLWAKFCTFVCAAWAGNILKFRSQFEKFLVEKDCWKLFGNSSNTDWHSSVALFIPPMKATNKRGRLPISVRWKQYPQTQMKSHQRRKREKKQRNFWSRERDS